MILDKARELGIALSETQEFQEMLRTKTALDENNAVSAMLKEFQDKQSELVNYLSEEEPDRLHVAALSRDVEALQEDLLENGVFAMAMQAQNAFQVLMREVNKEIAACIGMYTEENEECGGSCEGCSGCQH